MPRAPSGSPTSDSSATKRRAKGGKAASVDGKAEDGPRRVALACVSCRTRKIRCPAQQPECAVCKQDGRTCSYVRVTAAENAAARAKKHNSKLAKAARLAAEAAASPSADSASSATSSKGKHRADSSVGPEFSQDDTPPYLRLQTSWPLPPNSFGLPTSDGLPSSSMPLNLPSIAGAYGHQPFPPFSHSVPAPAASWNLPTHPNSLTSPASSEAGTSHSIMASSAPAAYPLPSFFNLPPPVPATTHAPSSGMFSYTTPAGYPNLPYQSYLSPPLQPYSAPHHPAAEYDPKAPTPTAPEHTADINNPRSAAYVDQSAASPFGASQAGSEAESWSSAHAHSTTSTSSGPFGNAHHLRHSSQTSMSDGCSPFMPAHFLPQAVPLGQQGQQAGQQGQPGAAFGGLGLELPRGGYPGQPFGAQDPNAFASGW